MLISRSSLCRCLERLGNHEKRVVEPVRIVFVRFRPRTVEGHREVECSFAPIEVSLVASGVRLRPVGETSLPTHLYLSNIQRDKFELMRDRVECDGLIGLCHLDVNGLQIRIEGVARRGVQNAGVLTSIGIVGDPGFVEW